MATPHAAASAVLVWGMRPSCGPAEIRCALQRSALDLEVAGRDNTTGFGLVQAVAAVNRLSVVNGNCTCA
jgi:serine protease